MLSVKINNVAILYTIKYNHIHKALAACYNDFCICNLADIDEIPQVAAGDTVVVLSVLLSFICLATVSIAVCQLDVGKGTIGNIGL